MIAIPVLGLPAVSVPTGVADGLPTGVQLFGGRYSDHLLLDAADRIEERAGRFWPDLQEAVVSP
ncbi:amidase family protein [Kribbella rubisoli]|uniref:amidase family protein n=1 Tax=Kribbella rubisoli TaxID=3075929 RepID=UPI00102CF2DB|nr:amidase family protein [Kribbella rubisoli]